MSGASRRSEVLDLLGGGGELSVTEIARRLEVSTATVRRDLAVLDHQGLVRRTHGGVRAPGGQTEVPVSVRHVRRIEQKRQIAQAATRYIHEDVAVVGMTGGTTTHELSRLMESMAGLTVITTGLNVAVQLVGNPRVRVLVAGGEARPMSLEVVGPIADEVISQLQMDVAFIGVDALDVQRGCLAHDALGAATNRVLARRALRRIVVADSSKIGAFAVNQICETSDVDVLITDHGVDAGVRRVLEEHGVTVDVA